MDGKIISDIYKQFGLLGLVVLLLGGVIIYIIWDRYQDYKKDKELNDKKKSGDYVSWESMNEKIKALEGEVDRDRENQAVQNEHLFNQTKTLFEKFDKMEGKFDKMDTKIDNKFDIITKILLERK